MTNFAGQPFAFKRLTVCLFKRQKRAQCNPSRAAGQQQSPPTYSLKQYA
jgi:hypothetical protein